MGSLRVLGIHVFISLQSGKISGAPWDSGCAELAGKEVRFFFKRFI